MIEEELRPLLETVRLRTLQIGDGNLSLENIRKFPDLQHDILDQYIQSNEQLVEKSLELEREKFSRIFLEFNFEGMNTIDILMVVSREIADKFYEISPSFSYELKGLYPEIYHHHFEERIQFISEKIRINLSRGIQQGMYRSDLSIELIARLYISRLNDLHNPDFFPPAEFSFSTLFNLMFENFIRSIATPEGLVYFEKRKEEHQF
ncbi:MAG: hypothetical protein ACOYN5_11605 [Bacteroidales bacterium]